MDLVFDGRRLLLRDQGKLVGAHGQLHLDFDELEGESERDLESSTLSITDRWQANLEELPRASWSATESPLTRDEMLLAAEEHEDAG
ncbi:MAG: hypothetical protein MUF23_15425, partial [Pirellula sp.]|nr:hypothetical protein [Pirellula sp.]